MFVRITLVGVLLGMPLVPAPPLTTIQDVLYRADGARFNGTLQINWNSFEAADTSNITMQGLSVKVVDGALRVQLVPNSNSGPGSYYTVRYNSDGKVQFQETWAVPQSTNPLRVREVRVTSPPPIQSGINVLQEMDVAGLMADLGTRPVKGSSFTPGRAAFIDVAGLLQGVTGDSADCVHVDGSSGPCTDAKAPEFVDGEIPGGIVDGANLSFALSAPPNPTTSVSIYRNGILQKMGQDYAVIDNTLQFVAANAPQAGDTLLSWYRLPANNTAASPYTLQQRAAASNAAPSAEPQILCAGTGAGTAQASCPIAAGTLQSGDRVEVRFDYARAGAAGSFSWEIHWGDTTVASGNPGDTLLTGRMDAGIYEAGTQLSWQTWGAAMPTTGGVINTTGPPPASIDLQGSGALLRNFTVLRFPRK